MWNRFLFRAPALLAFGLVFLVAESTARAVPACSAADIIANESVTDCPASSSTPCRIEEDYEIGDGCVLDFGARAVTIANGTCLDAAGGTMTLLSGNLTMESNSELRAKGATPDSRAGAVWVSTIGDITLASTGTLPKIDVSGGGAGGDINVAATGNIVIGGRLLADGNTDSAGLGNIRITGGGNVTVASPGQLFAKGGRFTFAGSVFVSAAGALDLQGTVDVTGGEGGEILLFSGGAATLNGNLTLNASADAGTGGAFSIDAGGNITLDKRIRAVGVSGPDGFAGDGGRADFSSTGGNITINADIIADAAGPDGSGDGMDIIAAGVVTIASTATISTRGAAQGGGGEVFIVAGTDGFMLGKLDASGGDTGGVIEVEVGRDLNVVGNLDVTGRSADSLGGEIILDGGVKTSGTLTTDSRLDAGAGGCNLSGCGLGGSVEVRSCLVLVKLNSRILANGPEGGDILLSSRSLLVAQAGSIIDATSSLGGVAEGTVDIVTAAGTAPTLLGTVDPTPALASNPLPRCGFCGNGTIDGGETCDDGNTNSCDGCSWFCQAEDCDDNELCTVDSCQPLLGCVHVNLPSTTACDDGRVCTTQDTCSQGRCEGVGTPCPPSGDPCNVALCTEEAQGCTTIPSQNGVICDDGDACTLIDRCAEGTCAGIPLECAPELTCVLGECVVASTELFLGVPVEGLSAEQGEDLNFFVTLEFASPRLRIASFNGTGNADVYLRRGEAPTLTEFDCAATSPDNFDKCLLGASPPDTYYVLLHAQEAFDGASVAASTSGSCTLSVAKAPASRFALLLCGLCGLLAWRRRAKF